MDDKQAAVNSSGTREHAPFDESVPSAWMKKERILVDYRFKFPELQFKYFPAYLPAYMILKNHPASFLTAADVKYVGGVVCLAVTFRSFDYSSPRPKMQN